MSQCELLGARNESIIWVKSWGGCLTRVVSREKKLEEEMWERQQQCVVKQTKWSKEPGVDLKVLGHRSTIFLRCSETPDLSPV